MAKSKKGVTPNQWSIIVVLIIVLGLAGGFVGAKIGSGNGSGAGGANGQEPGAFLEKIKANGKLRIGIALAPPMTMQEDDGTYGGPNIIPLQNLAKDLGVEVEPVPAEWNNIVAGLQADRYDFAASLDQTISRSMSISFTDSVWEYPGVFVVRADSKYTTADDVLNNTDGKIATAQGTALETTMKSLTKNTTSFKEYANSVSALNAKRVVGEFADYPAALAQVQADKNLKMIIPDTAIYQGKAAYGVPTDIDYRSLNVINVAIDRARNENDLDAAYKKVGYVPADDLPDTSPDLIKK
ncbi:transporter substrate-binding domain-containing protein [Brevibacterium sp. 91QC2O2]|uniref:transporter substrate-binding domain-containing protein n=1 Tax=Brevibacterium sp. 91QC2O2 TaxID=2968458 RepID=UPI00211C34AE|nr:transporter substrate-binding domain-containing protein [Brevibacterium sp. 91QC2O2]